MSEKKIVKLGIVGCCRGTNIARTIAGDADVKITALCDLLPDRIKTAHTDFEKNFKAEGIEEYTDFDEMLAKADIDAVVIATGANVHVPFAVKALDAGKHVLSEIPAVYSLEEAKKLKAAVKAHPELKYMLAENCCYWAFIQSWKCMYEDGKFGDIVYAESEYLHTKPKEEYKPYNADTWRSTNHAIRYLTHNLGPLLYIMDDRCVSVTCYESDIKYNPYRKAPATGVALFKTAKGAIIRILICFGAYAGFDHNFELMGTEGMIATDKNKLCYQANCFARLSEIPGTFNKKMEIPVSTAYRNEYGFEEGGGHGGADGKMMRAFIDCVINDTKPPIDIDLAINMSIPGILAEESAANGGSAIDIPSADEL